MANEIEFLRQTLNENEKEIVKLKNEIQLIGTQNKDLQEKVAKFPHESA